MLRISFLTPTLRLLHRNAPVRSSEASAFKAGLVTAQHKYEQVHQPHAEQQKQLDEREPANRDSQHQSDIHLSHPGSLNRPKLGGPVLWLYGLMQVFLLIFGGGD